VLDARPAPGDSASVTSGGPFPHPRIFSLIFSALALLVSPYLPLPLLAVASLDEPVHRDRGEAARCDSFASEGWTRFLSWLRAVRRGRPDVGAFLRARAY